MSRPSVSVVVPVYNDPDGLRATLSALVDQAYPDDRYEILVVDNGSDDATPDVIRAFVDRYPALIRHEVEREIQGSYAARNTGIEAATGSLLVFVDADVTMDETWLGSLCSHVVEAGADYVGCAVEVVAADPDSIAAKYNKHTAFPVERYLAEYGFAPTCGLAVRRAVVDAVGTFDGRLRSSGDKEFGTRVRDAGFTQAYAPDAPVYHPTRSAVELLAKHVRLGRGFEQLERRYPDRFDHGPLCSLRNLLPTVSPSSLADSASETRADTPGVGPTDLIGFYALEQLTDLARTSGRICERLGI
jgi:glycosyltransferase involved in cell wall biosynthesis